MESGWNVWVWLVGVGMASRSRWNLCVWLVVVVVRRYVYRFPHTTCVSVLFVAASLLFVHFLNVFRSCSSTFL